MARRLLLPALAVAALLAACAAAPPTAQVQVFASAQVAPGGTYRFDRLPSQVGQPSQANLEAAADAVLSGNGLRRDDQAGRYAVQLTATTDAVTGLSPWGGPSVGIGIGSGGGGGGIGFGFGFPLGGSAPAAQRVDVQVRDPVTGQVVFQSQAAGDTRSAPAALVRAALAGFPNGVVGVRSVAL
jgi:hypothetical protein